MVQIHDMSRSRPASSTSYRLDTSSTCPLSSNATSPLAGLPNYGSTRRAPGVCMQASGPQAGFEDITCISPDIVSLAEAEALKARRKSPRSQDSSSPGLGINASRQRTVEDKFYYPMSYSKLSPSIASAEERDG